MVKFSSSSPKSSSNISRTRRSNRRNGRKPTHKQVYDDKYSSKDEGSAWSSQSSRDNKEGYNSAARSSMAVFRDPKPVFLNGSQQGSSYINIAPLPIFQGLPNECPITHLSRFHKVCRANNASTIEEMSRIFPVTLEGEAGIWYDLNIEPYSSLSWEDVKEAFLQAYGGHFLDPQYLKAKLSSLNQGEKEGVRSYFLKLQWILKQCPDHGIPEGLIKEVFVGGLREDFKNWVLTRKPESLNEALRMAFDWERIRRVGGVRGEKKCGFCDGVSHEEGECEVRERMRELWLKSRGGDDGEEEERDGEEVAMVGLRRRREKMSMCQCSKHQCWKKLERNCSNVSASSSLRVVNNN